MTTKSKTNAFLAALVVAFLALFGWSASASASSGYTTTKYDTTFVYQGDNLWTVIPHVPNAAIHNIGSKQSWLCNANKVEGDPPPCTPERAYGTNGDIQKDGRSCVYIQGDNPAWDTVPNTEKEVCAPLTPTPEPSVIVTTPPFSTPTPEVTASPTSTPSPSSTSSPTPEPSPSKDSPETSPSPTPTPGETSTTVPSSTSLSPSSGSSSAPIATSPVAKQLAATGSSLGQTALFVIFGITLITIAAILLINRRRG